MSWKEINVMDQRIEFVNRSMTDRTPFSELCKEYGISRKTGYKWVQRFKDGGYPNLGDESRKPNNHADALSEDEIIHIIELKAIHPNWGARKIQELMKRSKKTARIPSESSIKRVMDKAGLVKKKRRSYADPSVSTLRNILQPDVPNDVWTVDFKGWWLSTDLRRCNPLTLRDDKSKYLLDVRVLDNQRTGPVKEAFEEAFKNYGLPSVIRSDNGSPFACSNSVLGLTKLSAWWISLGILPDRIVPGKPCQNGGHERMHKDLKLDIQSGIKVAYKHTQPVIDAWRHEFNHIRPHEALQMKTPSEVYTPSPRKYHGDIEEIIYSAGIEPRKVGQTGMIKIRNTDIHISRALSGYQVGLDEYEDKRYKVWFNNFYLGILDLYLFKFLSR